MGGKGGILWYKNYYYVWNLTFCFCVHIQGLERPSLIVYEGLKEFWNISKLIFHLVKQRNILLNPETISP